MKTNQVNMWLDIFLAIGLMMAMIPGVTGIPIHQRIGIVVGAGVAVHHFLHWKWIAATGKAFARLSGAARLKLVLNILSLVAFSLTIVSGVMNAGAVANDAGAEIAIQRSGLAFRREGLLQRQAGRGLARPALQREDSGFHWHVIHHASALLTFLTVALHLALHRVQIAKAMTHFVPGPLPGKEVVS